MQVLYFFRHMKKSDTFAEKIEQKLAHYENILDPQFPVRVSVEEVKGLYRIHISAHGSKNNLCDVEAFAEDPYKCLEEVAEKLVHTLTKAKDKMVRNKRPKKLPVAEVNQTQGNDEDEDFIEMEEMDVPAFTAGARL